jgi:hypothetical protein
MSYGTVQAEKMTTESGYSLGAGNASSFKNRIINGGMVIDQRNAGASVNSAADGSFAVDRFASFSSGGGIYTTQRSTDVPTGQGFVNSIVSTVTTTDSPTGTDYYLIQQGIEGLNTADLMWGTANAKSITFSFWVKSSITGTYTVAVRNSGFNRSYRATYTVNSANTWEYKTITVPGDTTGTWLTTNGVGIRIGFTLGAGSDYIDTGNVWSAIEDFAATGQVQWVATSGATFFLTGVQLEVGTVATSFDYRSIGTELALCQRYCCVFSGANAYYARKPIFGTGPNTAFWYAQYPVPMRTTPATFTAVNVTSGTLEGFNYTTSAAMGNISNANLTEGDNLVGPVNLVFASGISAGQVGSWRWILSPTASFIFSAEL